MNQQNKILKFALERKKRRKKDKKENGQALVEYLLIATMLFFGFSALISLIAGDQVMTDKVMGFFVSKLNLFSFVLSMPF